MKYQIGQVLYVVKNDRLSIIPVQVVEESIRKSLIDGVIEDTVTYFVLSPKGKQEGNTPVNLSSIKGDLYDDLDIVKNMMQKNALASINNIIKKTQKIQAQIFGIKTPPLLPADKTDADLDISPIPLLSEASVNAETDEDSTMIELPDGTQARLKMSPEVRAALS